jgi:heme exporter protein C
MPKWFNSAVLVCGVMFAISPLVIAQAPYESTMGLVQKVFYYHMPSAWIFLTASVVCGIASARFLATGKSRHDRTALAAA